MSAAMRLLGSGLLNGGRLLGSVAVLAALVIAGVSIISGFQGLAQGTLDGGHGVLANFLLYPFAAALGGGAGAFLGASLMHLGERLVDR